MIKTKQNKTNKTKTKQTKQKQNKTKTKNEFLKNIFDKALKPFCKIFLRLKQLYSGKLLIFRQAPVSVSKFLVVQNV